MIHPNLFISSSEMSEINHPRAIPKIRWIDKLKVSTHANEGFVYIKSLGFNKKIRMKNSFWDLFTGSSWEERVRLSQKKAFMESYKADYFNQ